MYIIKAPNQPIAEGLPVRTKEELYSWVNILSTHEQKLFIWELNLVDIIGGEKSDLSKQTN